MFFFFVGGVEQQAGRVLRSGAGRCVRCGSASADLVEYENVLKLFFFPVWRWPGKQPALYCRDCSFLFPSSSSSKYHHQLEEEVETDLAAPVATARCGSCDRPVEPGFRFCPFCGHQL